VCGNARFTRKEKQEMAITTRGFSGQRKPGDAKLPPGQYVTTDFPVLSAGPTPKIPLDGWEFTISQGSEVVRRWDWKSFRDLPAETITIDLHCVTRWSKLGTVWEGVSLDTLFKDLETDAEYVLVDSYGGYTTNLPLADLMNHQAWVAFRFDDDDLAPEHGGPARLLVPHLYLWKSAKWVKGITLMHEDQPGFWEGYGYHNYGDPWREERYSGDE
jgi:DMSO/TMAO reductase YedYZ molybdopterin-dependent catalytic subunit